VPSNLKKLVRARMAETGEGWQAALSWVRSQSEPVFDFDKVLADAMTPDPDDRLAAHVANCADCAVGVRALGPTTHSLCSVGRSLLDTYTRALLESKASDFDKTLAEAEDALERGVGTGYFSKDKETK